MLTESNPDYWDLICNFNLFLLTPSRISLNNTRTKTEFMKFFAVAKVTKG